MFSRAVSINVSGGYEVEFAKIKGKFIFYDFHTVDRDNLYLCIPGSRGLYIGSLYTFIKSYKTVDIDLWKTLKLNLGVEKYGF